MTDDVPDEYQERRQHDQAGQDDQTEHQPVPQVAAFQVHEPALPTSMRRWIQAAVRLTARETRNSQKPTAIRLDRCRLSTASRTSLTMTEGIVAAGPNRVRGSRAELPISMATAIVSPRARPKERTAPAMMPPRAYGSTARRSTSQRVAPRPQAASRCSAGTSRIASRARAVVNGTIIRASTRVAVMSP